MIKARTDPSITEGARRFLEEYITPEMNVLEFGAGGSTIWFARNARKVITIEHNEVWFDYISEQLKQENLSPKARIILSEQPYNNVPISLGLTFDLILIDGRDRVLCAESSCGLLNPGRYMMLDNSNRTRYNKIFSMLNGWEKYSHTQKRPDEYGTFSMDWTTTWWRKP
ncbi:MAG: hypothetical protein Q8O94_02925 [bacterium]|nr:hypothetical protein [bacterium]